MKPPDLIAIYSTVPAAPERIAEALLDLLIVPTKSSLDEYYAHLAVRPTDGQYDAVDESLDLEGRDDLISRVNRDRNSGFTLSLSIGLYPGLVYVWLFEDPSGGEGTAVHLRIDPEITRSVEDEEDNRPLVVMWLTHVAAAIGSDWFISGPFIEQWRPLALEQLRDAEHVRRWGRLYVAGWKRGSPAEAAIRSALDPPADAVKQTTVGHAVWANFPDL